MTVSRLLANPAAVAGDTGERIRAAIERLGYVPDRIAGGLSSRRTGSVALVLPTLTNTNFADTAHGLTDALRPAGYQLIVGYTMYDVAEEERVVRALLARRPEALVLTETIHARGTTQLLLGAGIPVVESGNGPTDRGIFQLRGRPGGGAPPDRARAPGHRRDRPEPHGTGRRPSRDAPARRVRGDTARGGPQRRTGAPGGRHAVLVHAGSGRVRQNSSQADGAK